MVAVLTPRHGHDPVTGVGRSGAYRDGPPVRRSRSVGPLRLVPAASTGPPRPGFDGLAVALAAPPTRKPVRRPREAPEVYRRRRTVALGLLTLVAIGVWLGVHSLLVPSGSTLGPTRSAAALVWTVKPGDTLWSIALSVQRHGDIRPLVDALSAEVHGQPLTVGEQITIP